MKKAVYKAVLICILLIMVTIASQWIAIASMKCYTIEITRDALAGLSEFPEEGPSLWGKGIFQSETAPTEMTVTFDGKTYTGTYSYSLCAAGSGFVADYYRPTEDTGSWTDFSVVAGTEKLASINLVGEVLLGKQKEKQIIDGAAVAALAKAWASNYIDTEQYAMRLVHGTNDTENDVLLYDYEFVKRVEGRDTTDRLTLKLTDRGDLLQISGLQSQWTKGKGLALRRLCLVNVERKLQQALGGIQYQIRQCYYGITPEGKPVIMIDCRITRELRDGTGLFVIQ